MTTTQRGSYQAASYFWLVFWVNLGADHSDMYSRDPCRHQDLLQPDVHSLIKGASTDGSQQTTLKRVFVLFCGVFFKPFFFSAFAVSSVGSLI